MGRFLTGPARLQQSEKRRLWRLLDNELFLDSDGSIYLAPKNMYTDNYTIPMWIAWLAGSPVDFDVRCSHIHDLSCYTMSIIKVKLTEKELRDMGYLKFKTDIKMTICENIPANFLEIKKVNKLQINNIFYRCMKACKIPKINRIMIRLGVCFNFGWYIDKWLGRVFNIELDKIYTEDFWRKHVWYKK